jgi:type IV pilus assembly protein PilC
MKEHPRAFDEVTVSYIESGEESGELVETTERLSVMLAKRAALVSKIKGVSAYPKMVGGAIGIMVIGIILFLVPMYADIYASFGAELPGPTLALMWVADHFLPVGMGTFELFGIDFPYPRPYPFNIGSFLLYILIGIVIFRRKTRDNLEIGRKLDRIVYRLPLVGALTHKQTLQRWATTLAGALASGVPMTRAIDLAAASSGSRWHQSIAPDLAEAVRTGRTISSEVEKHPDLYPPNVRTMLATGEQTGEIDSMLDSVAEALDSDIDAIVAGLSAKVEVALLLVLGLVVGGLLLVLYMPILQLATTASNGLGG